MSLRGLPTGLALGIATLITLSACSGQNPTTTTAARPTTTSTTSKTSTTTAAMATHVPPEQVVAVLRTSIQQASSVHVEGYVSQNSQTITVDLRLNRNGSSSGLVTTNGIGIPFLVANGVTYVRLTDPLVESQGIAAGSATEAQMVQKWVRSTSKFASGVVPAITPLSNYTTFLTGLIDGIGKVAWTGPGEDSNILVDRYGEVDDTGASVSVGQAPPHLLIASRDGVNDGGGYLTYTWNQETRIDPPPAGQLYTGPGA